MAMIEAQIREGSGTGPSRQVRREARVPAVLYGGEKENRNLSVNLKDWLKLLDTEGSALRTHRQDMVIDDRLRVAVLMRDYQIHPVTGLPLHIDFMRFDPNQVIEVKIPVHVLNEEKCPGIKAGGVLEHILKELEVRCRTADLPNFIELSVLKLQIGDAIHTSDITLPEGVEVASEENLAILTITGVKAELSDETVDVETETE